MHLFFCEMCLCCDRDGGVKDEFLEGAKFVAFLGYVVVVEGSSIPEGELEGRVGAGGERKWEIKPILCFHQKGILR